MSAGLKVKEFLTASDSAWAVEVHLHDILNISMNASRPRALEVTSPTSSITITSTTSSSMILARRLQYST